MYLKTLKLENFRKFERLEVKFNDRLNVLIGENDSGKTAIVDAIKQVLLTQSFEYLRLDEDDFYNKQKDEPIRIECQFSGFSDKEAGNFLEWIGFDDKNEYVLKVWLTAEYKDNRIITDVRAGMDDSGSQLDGNARNLLRATYLKPLRDAD